MTLARARWPVLLAHADGDEAYAERLAEPLRAAGYDVVHRGSVLVGESLLAEATRVLVAGGPVVLCGTIRAMGTRWASQVVNAARAYRGVRIYGVQIERDANLAYLTFDTEVATYWLDPDRAAAELVTALTRHYPIERDAPAVEPSYAAVERRFQALLLDTCDIIDLANLPADRHVATRQLMLRSLFVPLKVTVERAAGQDLDPDELVALERRRATTSGGRLDSAGQSAGGAVRADRPPEAPAGLREAAGPGPIGLRLRHSRRLVILGDPGAGKTTLLRWIATAYLLRLRGDPEWAALPAVDTLPDEDWLPVLIRCRDLGPAQLAGTLDDILVHVLRRSELAGSETAALRQAVSRRLDDGTALLLIDGLDEIADPVARSRFCRQLEQIHLARPNAPIVATSRIVGYRELGYRIGRGFEHLTIAELDRPDKDEFIKRWCAVTEHPSRQQTMTAELISDLHSTDRIERLTSNPLLLTTMALVKRKLGKLPDRRADLYREAVDVLLNWRSEVDAPIDHHEAIPQLEYIAYAMSDRGVQQLVDDEIVALLEQMRVEYPQVHPIHRRGPVEFIALLERRTGILVQAGQARRPGRLAPIFEFRHLTFQEYLAALALVNGRFPGRDRSRTLAEHVTPLAGRLGTLAGDDSAEARASWRETIRLCATICNDDDVDGLLAAVLTPAAGEDPEVTGEVRAVLAAACLEDEPNAGPEIVDRILRALVGQLPPDDSTTSGTAALLGISATRWGDVVLVHLLAELRTRGEPAVPYLGRRCGEAADLSGAGPGRRQLDLPAVLGAEPVDPDTLLLAVLATGHRATINSSIETWAELAPLLVDLVESTDPLLAGAAAWALARIRNTAPGWQPTDREVDRMLAVLGRTDGQPTRVLSLAEAAGARRVGAVALAPVLAAASGPDPLARASAVRLLSVIAQASLIGPVIERLADPDAEVRARAAWTLGQLDDRDAVEPLIAALADPVAQVRSSAADALAELRDQRSVEALLAARADPEPAVRRDATWALGLLGDGRAVDPLLADFPGLTPVDAWSAASALGRLGADRAVDALLDRFGQRAENLSWWIADALRDLGSPRSTERLLAALADPSDEARKAALVALGELGDTSRFDLLAAAVADPESTVRQSAVRALGELADSRGVPALLTALTDPDREVRADAAEQLGRLADTRTTAPLGAALDDVDPRVRRNAVAALARADSDLAYTHLVRALTDPDPTVRANAATALGEFDRPEATEALLAALTDPVADVRAPAGYALGLLGQRVALPEVRHRLTDPDPSVRDYTMGGLGLFGDRRSFGAIVERLTGPDSNERVWAGFALLHLGDARAVPALLTALDDPAATVRQWATNALAQFAPEQVREAIAARLDDPQLNARLTAVEALGTLADPAALPHLLPQLADPHPFVRDKAARSIAQLGDPGAADALLPLLADPHPGVREAAARSLGELGEPAAVLDALLGQLADPHPRAVSGAAWGLGRLGDPSAADRLIPLLDSPIGQIRLPVVEALPSLLGADAAPRLSAALDDPRPAVRERAAYGLGRQPGDGAVPALLAALADPGFDVRSMAARALGRIGDGAALRPLLAALDDPEERVRCFAAQALGRLGDPSAIPGLRSRFDGGRLWERIRSAWALAGLGETRWTEELAAQVRQESVGPPYRAVIAMLAGLGDQQARRLSRRGLRAASAATRRNWLNAFHPMLPDLTDADLLSEQGDGQWPLVDPARPVSAYRISRMSRVLRCPPDEVRRRYADLATTLPLRLG